MVVIYQRDIGDNMEGSFARLGREERWSLSEGKLTLHHPMMDVFWQVPDDFSMPSLPVLGLAEYVFLTPFKERVELEPPIVHKLVIVYVVYVPLVFGRQNFGVSFSG